MIHSWLPSSWRWRPYWRRWRSSTHREGRKCPHRTPGGIGGTYLSIFGGSTGPWPRRYEELALRFLPRLDPLAQALTLTFRGAYEEIPVDLSIVAAAES
jgi:hypothetical protein